MVFDPNDPTGGAGGGTGSTSGGTQYLGDVPHARILGYRDVPQDVAPGNEAAIPTMVKGYKKGDQLRLLPKPGGDLANLQQALYQAGYLSKEQFGRLALGSPDQVTVGAFEKLLASSNMTGVEWHSTLAQRLAAAAYAPPEDDRSKLPALTIELSNPDDIKATLQSSARKLLGGFMSEEQANAFVAQFQNAQREQQIQSYNQQYQVAGTGEHGEPLGYAGAGGETIAAPDMGVAAENFAKTTDPNQYMATQFGTAVNNHLANLRNTGYL